MIHLYQARACHDSWLLFYLRYGWYWLMALRYRRHLENAGYRLNPFEMEAYALYLNAARAGKHALALLTISDNPFTGEGLDADARQNTFTQMMEIALEIA